MKNFFDHWLCFNLEVPWRPIQTENVWNVCTVVSMHRVGSKMRLHLNSLYRYVVATIIAIHHSQPNCQNMSSHSVLNALCTFHVFSWCSGYHICLTHRRSPVRSRAKTNIFVKCCWTIKVRLGEFEWPKSWRQDFYRATLTTYFSWKSWMIWHRIYSSQLIKVRLGQIKTNWLYIVYPSI